MASHLIERLAYDGQYKLTHNPFAKGSQPRYTVENTETGRVSYPKGVTTILGDTLAKDFTSWALECMEQALTDKLQAISTVDMTSEEVLQYVNEAIPAAKQASARRRQDGADTGSLVHALIETYLTTGEVALSSDLPDEAKNALGAFMHWFQTESPVVIASEQVVYSPAIDIFTGSDAYAGCYDALLTIRDKVYLTDFKTTNASRYAPLGIYPEYFLQLGAYAHALRRERNFTGRLDGLMVVSIRKDGQLDVVTNRDINLTMAECETAFLDVLSTSVFMRSLRNKLKGAP